MKYLMVLALSILLFGCQTKPTKKTIPETELKVAVGLIYVCNEGVGVIYNMLTPAEEAAMTADPGDWVNISEFLPNLKKNGFFTEATYLYKISYDPRLEGSKIICGTEI